MSLNRRIGARAWSAYTAYDLAAALVRSGGLRDVVRVGELLGFVQEEAASIGMKRLLGRAQTLLGQVPGGVKCLTSFGEESSAMNGSGKSGEGRDDHGSSAPGSTNSETTAGERKGSSPENDQIFRREAEYWTLGYQGRVVRLKHLKGLGLIAHLLRHPGLEFHVVELAEVTDPGSAKSRNDADHNTSGSDIGPVLDASAKHSYRQRLRELREDLEEAQSFNDAGRAAKIEQEIAFLTRELAHAVGLFGRDRRAGSQTERARLRVTNAIKSAIAKISRHHSQLGRYLSLAVRTGTFCSYAPDPELPAFWEL